MWNEKEFEEKKVKFKKWIDSMDIMVFIIMILAMVIDIIAISFIVYLGYHFISTH